MPDYRMYRIDDHGHINGLAAELICDTDEQAIEQARQFVDGAEIEVWNRGRFVKRLEKA